MNATIAIKRRIIEIVRSLPLAKQKQILDFAEFICSQNTPTETPTFRSEKHTPFSPKK